MILTTVVVLPSIASGAPCSLFEYSTENVTFSHLFLLRNGVLTPAQVYRKKKLDLSQSFFFIDFERWMRMYFFVRFGWKQTKCRLGFQPNNTKSWRLEVS